MAGHPHTTESKLKLSNSMKGKGHKASIESVEIIGTENMTKQDFQEQLPLPETDAANG